LEYRLLTDADFC